MPVVYYDERYSTVEAEQRLLDAGLKRDKRKALRDQLAAQIMLQGYLDAGCPETEAPAAPLADADDTGSEIEMIRTGPPGRILGGWDQLLTS